MEQEGTPSATRLAAAIALVLVAGVWSWWAAKEGAYFGSVMYPGLVLLAAGFVLVSSRSAWRAPLRLSMPARLAIGGLLALAAWSALSALWSPSPEVAVADAQRIFGYGLAFGLGLWLCVLLRNRIELAMVPLAFAGLFAGAVALVALLSGDDYVRYIDAGTLQYPIGYRNANAAFFLIAVWPAVTLAASRELDWRFRGIALGIATLCLALGALSQSRGSMIGVAAALVVYVAVSRERGRAVGWLALAAIPALIVIPAMEDLYATADIDGYVGTAELRAAGRAALGGALISLVIGSVAAFVGGRITASATRAEQANRAVAAGAVALVVAGAIGFVVATGDPVGWVDERIDEFLTQGSPGTEGQSSRFGVNAGSERDDLWRVALEDAGEEPVLGLGGGGFQYSYLLDRSEEGIESVRDAHSVELEILSELGFPGLLFLLLALGGGAVAAWRARAVSPAAAALATCALTAGAYWLAHSSIDWFWTYPALTAPVFALLGSACVPALGGAPAAASSWRRLAAVGAVLLAITVVPPFLAERYIESAYAGWRSDPERAQDDLDRASKLNTLSIEPLLAEGGIAREAGDDARAIAAFEAAAAERPEEWATHYFLATLYRREDPRRARVELDRAFELNPLSELLAEFEERFEENQGN